MIIKLASYLTDYLEKNKIIQSRKEIYTIGFSLMLNTFLSYSVVILLSLKNNLLIESFLFISSFGFLREYIGGYHANSYFTCFIQYIFLFFTAILFLQIPIYFLIVLTILSLLILTKIAPIEHPNNPFDSLKEERFKRMWKKRMLLCIIISFPLFYIKVNYGKIIYINILLITVLAYLQYLNNKNVLNIHTSFSFLNLNKFKETKNNKTISNLFASLSSLFHRHSKEPLQSKSLLRLYGFIANIAFITAITTVNTVSRQTLYQPKLPDLIK